MLLLGDVFSLLESTPMTSVRVITCKERIPSRKHTSMEPDGYVYTLTTDNPKQPVHYIIFFGMVDDLFDKHPSLHYINPNYLKKLEDNASKRGNKTFSAYDAICEMKTSLEPNALMDETVTPEVLKVLQEYEITKANDFFVKCGGCSECYRPPFLIKETPSSPRRRGTSWPINQK